MVAKSDWGLITDTEPLKPTIQYTSSISPNLPPFPTSEGNYTLKCTVNSSGNAMLSWIAMS